MCEGAGYEPIDGLPCSDKKSPAYYLERRKRDAIMQTTYIKTTDGVITNIHGLMTHSNSYTYGDKIPHLNNEVGKERYFLVNSHSGIKATTKECYTTEISQYDIPLLPDLRDGEVYFRPHAGSLLDAMRSVRVISNKNALVDIIKEFLCSLGRNSSDDPSVFDIKVESYGGYDDRIGWNTYIVTYGTWVIGFLSGPLPE
jgi:hypothetical protein